MEVYHGAERTMRRKRLQELNKMFKELGIIPSSIVDTKNHVKITLPDGRKLSASSTPSDRREIKNLKAKIRKVMQ